MQPIDPTLRARTYLVKEHSVHIFASLNVTHTTCKTGTNQVAT